MTISAAGRLIVNIARINILNAVFPRDPPGLDQSLGRRTRLVAHAVIRIEGREMDGHIGSRFSVIHCVIASISAGESFSPGIKGS